MLTLRSEEFEQSTIETNYPCNPSVSGHGTVLAFSAGLVKCSVAKELKGRDQGIASGGEVGTG